MKRQFPLAYKTVIAFLIVLLPIVIIFLLSLKGISTTIDRLILEELRVIAGARADDVELFLEMAVNRMQDFSSDGVIRSGTEAVSAPGDSQSEALSRYISENKLPLLKDFYRITVSDTKGRIVASTNSSIVGEDMSSEESFVKGRAGLSISILPSGYMEKPELAVSAPIFSMEDQRLTGVLTGYIPFEMLATIFSPGMEGAGAHSREVVPGYRTFDLYLVNRDKLMITPSWLIEDSVLVQRVDSEAVRACLEDKRDHSGFYEDYRGMEVAGASFCMPELGWVLLVEVDRSEAATPVRSLQLYVLFTAIVIVALISALVLYFFRLVIRQLKALASASAEMASGNYGVRVPVKSSDEIGLLSEAFNTMAREIKQRTDALAESEERFRGIMENTTSVVYVKDPDCRYLFINKRYEELFGITNGEIRGKSDYDIFPAEAAKAFCSNDLKALASGRPLEFEEIAPHEDGPHTYVSVKFRLMGADGRPYAVAGISTDITELKRSHEALVKSEESLENAQRIAHIGNWDLDIVANELRWSDEIYRIFGVAPQEFGATYEAFLGFVHPDDRDYVQSCVNEALIEKRPYSIDHRILLPDGAEKVVHEQGEVTFDPSGKPLKMSGTVQDITERKRAEDEVRKLAAELEERVARRTAQLEAANSELEAFSYSVAHDLKSPLRIISGFSQMLLKDYSERLDTTGADYLRRLHAASHRMGQLIDALLKLSQVMKAEMRSERVYLSGMARAIAADLRRVQPERKAEFVIEENLSAQGDSGLLRIVMENLVGNAWKFTGKRDVARIEFGSAGERDGRTVFFVRDNGAGFEMKYAEKLFDPFQRLHGPDEFPGTGIGLATVSRIIQRHGGEIWAEGEKDRGAAFYFTL